MAIEKPTWALSLVVTYPPTVTVLHLPVLVSAASEAEAIGKGIILARRVWPSEKGWQQHHCEARRVYLDSVVDDLDDVHIVGVDRPK